MYMRCLRDRAEREIVNSRIKLEEAMTYELLFDKE